MLMILTAILQKYFDLGAADLKGGQNEFTV